MNERGFRLKSWTTRQGVARGGERFQKTNVSRILNDPIYIGKVRYKGSTYDGQHQAIISNELFNAVQGILQANNITKSGYRQAENTFLLKGLIRCGSCKTAMAPSYAIKKGKKYFYYRCNVDNDKSKAKCRISSVHAQKVEQLMVDELKFLSQDPRIIEGVVENATRDQKVRVKELALQKKTIQDKLLLIDKKAKNLIDVLSESGSSKRSGFLAKQIDDLDLQAEQLKSELEAVEFESNDLDGKLLSADIIKENFKVFRDVYDHLTIDEKYDLLHLLIKKVIYYEGSEADADGNKAGKIKMDLWELPPIDPSILSSTNDFAERNVWLSDSFLAREEALPGAPGPPCTTTYS